MGRVVTFYSYKGGVGRTFALANVAVLLAKWGKRVLCVDWDLEAPGLVQYFGASLGRRRVSRFTVGSRVGSPLAIYASTRPPEVKGGVVDVVASVAEETQIPWQELVVEIKGDDDWAIDLLAAGAPGDDYVRRLHALDWGTLYAEYDLGWALEAIREEWLESYDFVLIDSRTGLTDIGGICAAQMPDLLVVLSSANEQSLRGCVDVIDRARKARDRLPIPRPSPLVLPLVSRFDDREEYDEATRWLERFASAWAEEFEVWTPKGTDPRKLLNLLRIPYVGKWSFGESLPARFERIDDPALISWSMATVAACLARGLGHGELLLDNRDGYVREVAGELVGRPAFGYDVFLVYSQVDSALSRRVYDALSRRGLRVFSQLHLDPEHDWERAVADAIETSRLVVALVTENLMSSHYAQDELVLALRKSRPSSTPRVVPWVFDDVDVPYGLKHLVPLVSAGDLEADADALVRVLKKA